MRVLHLLPTGNAGGVERLCYDYARFSKHENHFYFMWGGGEIAEAIKQIYNNVIERSFKYTQIIKEYCHLCKYIEGNKIDVILIQFPSPVFLLYCIPLKIKYPKVRQYIYIPADPNVIFKSSIKKIIFKCVETKTNGCIAISKFVKSELNKYCEDEHIKLIYNGVDCKRFLTGSQRKKNEYIHLIFVGRLVDYKGVDILLNALSSIDYPYHLTVVGDGVEKENLVLQCKRLGLDKKVVFVGNQNDVSLFLNDADIFVHPARCKEGFGLTIVESMAAGVPCVAFLKGAIGEIITDKKDGFLVVDNGEKALSECLNKVMEIYYNDYESLLNISNNAIERAWDFDIQKYVKNLDDWLNGEQCND